MFWIFGQGGAPILDQVSSWEKYGLPGLIILALFSVLAFFIRQHYIERKEWRDDIKTLTDRQLETTQETADKFVNLHRETIDRLTKN